MSIEADLNRIATSLEEIVKRMPNPNVAVSLVKESKKKEKDVAPVEVEQNPFDDTNNAAASEVTFEMLEGVMRHHAEKLGNMSAIALIKKHGADPAQPKLKTIPQANYQACYDEATADLAKVNKKGK